MSKTQVHEGLRLKNKIERSHLKKRIISEKSGIPLSSIYDLYKKPELLRSKILPILQVIEVDPDEFYGFKTEGNDSQANNGFITEIESLRREIELLKQQITDKDEIIALLKNKRK